MSASEPAEQMSGTGLIRSALLLAGCGVLSVSATACESTEQESAKLAAQDRQSVTSEGVLKLGARNRSVRVSDVTLVKGSGRTALAVKLTGTSSTTQVNVPLLVNVTGTAGRVLYSNATGGLEASLQRIGALAPGKAQWWVDDQVLTTETPTGASVTVGTGGAAKPGTRPTLGTSSLKLTQQAGQTVLSGELVNHSPRAASKVPVFAVALHGTQVTAAGRAVVEALPGGANARAPFEIFLVGNTTGATLQVSAVATGA